MQLKDKVALITGAGRGIGQATAFRFSSEGARVAINDVDEEAGRQTVSAIQEKGGEAFFVPANITRRSEVEAMIDQVTERWKRLDILVNNAGINRDALTVRIKDGEVKKMDEEAWDSVINVNLKGTFLCCQAAAVPMIQQKSGRITNTASIAMLGYIGQANYSASKAGIGGLTRTLALELAPYNINVNCIAPGGVKTRMTAGIPEKIMEKLLQTIPLRRMAEPEEIAALHAYLVSDEASYITGQIIFIDGGLNLGR
ncbi:MAG: beta-ketoacyl-ACP reductase [Acidobacteria bacterium]|nr:beta-ketoacyl-ACP reductase [Acidobacteriota bacterium]